MFVEKEYYYIIEDFEKYGIFAGYTKKNAGNMSDFCPLEGQVEGTQGKNREKVLLQAGLGEKKQVFAYQTHSSNVKIITEETGKYCYEKAEDTDAFVTKRKDVVLCTFYADCLPIFAYDKKNKAIGMAHSGWLGTYREMLKSLLQTMKKECGSEEDDILLAFGIGIRWQDYEVGKEFYEKFLEKFGDKEYEEILKNSFHYIEKNIEESGKYYFDNTNFNKEMAIKLGILEENIIIANENTFDEKFHSHRRDGKKAGRAMGFIAFKK